MKIQMLIVILLGFGLPVQQLQANTASDKLQAAEQAYFSGDFEAAIAFYQNLLAQGYWHPVVLYNLGNSYYRAGLRGEALAAYFQAYELQPRDRDLRHNIDHLLEKNLSDVAWEWSASPLVRRASLYGLVSREELLLLSLSFWGLSGLSLGLLALQRYQRVGAAFFLFLPTAVYLTVLVQLIPSLWPKWGAVSRDQVTVYSSPSEVSGLSLFKLRKGAPLVVRERNQGWYLVELPDRKQGWVAGEDFAFFARQ